MISINLAFDEEIASELTDYLTNLWIDSRLEGTQVLVNKTDFDEEILFVVVFYELTVIAVIIPDSTCSRI